MGTSKGPSKSNTSDYTVSLLLLTDDCSPGAPADPRAFPVAFPILHLLPGLWIAPAVALKLAGCLSTAGSQAEAGRRPHSRTLLHVLSWGSSTCDLHDHSARTAPLERTYRLSLQGLGFLPGWGTGHRDGPDSKSTPTNEVSPFIHPFCNVNICADFPTMLGPVSVPEAMAMKRQTSFPSGSSLFNLKHRQ